MIRGNCLWWGERVVAIALWYRGFSKMMKKKKNYYSDTRENISICLLCAHCVRDNGEILPGKKEDGMGERGTWVQGKYLSRYGRPSNMRTSSSNEAIEAPEPHSGLWIAGRA